MLNRGKRVCCLSGALIVLAGCAGTNVYFREARKAELRKDWDTALVNFDKALQIEPENAKYLIHEKWVRQQGSAFHVLQGRRLANENKPDEAAGEFQKAVSMDPTNMSAAQELGRILAAQAAAKKTRESTLKQAMKATEEGAGAAGVVKLKPFPQKELAQFRITGDSRKVFETLAQLAGLNVAFTSDFHPAPLSVNLTNIKIEDALHVVSLQTKSFWRPITPNTILVVPDTATNRRDYDVEVLKTIYLSNPLQAADRTAITTALKQVLGLQHIIDNPDSNAIIIRDSPEKVAAAEDLIHDLDRGKAEIMIEVSVIEADRDRARDLGLTPATFTSTTPTPGLQGAAVYEPTLAAASAASGSAAAAAAATGLHLSTRDYSIAVPSAVVSAVLNDTRTHILQNPQVRVTDGQKATLKIGQRIPYATGSFMPSLGGVTGGSGSSLGLLGSTQFQFQDVGVNLELTPHLLADGEVAIHASIEISSLGASVTIAGIAEPTFGQRKIEHDIRLKEGEVNILGGLLQTTQSHVRNGTPILGDIPLLHYLFSADHIERQESEVLVMLTPRVVRLPEPAMTAGGNVAVTGAVPPSGEALPVPEAMPPTPGRPEPPAPPGLP